MIHKTAIKEVKRVRRHARVRARVVGTEKRPRLSVYKSNTRVIAQIIDDAQGVTLAAVSSSALKGASPRERAILAAKEIATQAKAKGISAVVFDRGGFQYTGTIKAFADSAREAGLQF